MSIILVSYNVKYFLEQCLWSVNKAIRNIEAEIWVVDNASTDGSVRYLQSRFSRVNFIENTKNTGFAKANNQALAKCSGKYVLFLNPDTLIPENSLAKCIAFMDTNEQSGALGVRMLDGNGIFLPESKRSLPSPLSSFYKLSGLSRFFPKSKIFSRYSLTYLSEFENHEVEVLSGAFMLVKRDLLTELKGFDEAFFMYGEDIDLSYRIRQLGYKNYYFSRTSIIHFKGESTKKTSLSYTKMFYKAMSIFVRKHYGSNSSFLNTFFIHSAIKLAAGVSAAAQMSSKAGAFLSVGVNNILRTKNRKSNFLKQSYAIVAGSDEEYEEVKTLLAELGFAEKMFVRGFLNEKQKIGISGSEKLTESGKITEMIFCAGDLNYSFIIDKIQEIPKGVSLRFHGKGTRSIVGSDSKNTVGKVMFSKDENTAV